MTKAEYQKKVFAFLHKMKVGSIEELDFLPNSIMPSKIAKAFFIDIVKTFIENDEGREAGFYIELNSAYQKIKKTAYFIPGRYTPPRGGSAPEQARIEPTAKIQASSETLVLK